MTRFGPDIGPVTYLPPPPVGGYNLVALGALIDPHPARSRRARR
ncbi:hypothetical protein ACIBED_19085 [Rhodococcus coprophilus]|uniref:Uncharacterized protein n=1 Tax=Rhodococcus coprophilus TaxID=38310 RepID=A0A2X4TZT3_9NOCA|nr:hypothetical protein [Rhodococcus coprophilus]MBM7458609.1 hypothetical protein [Rhodococcus coprophilus]SQI33016.1 Uncharacterised protein [Rhodococcus coprophilus]